MAKQYVSAHGCACSVAAHTVARRDWLVRVVLFMAVIPMAAAGWGIKSQGTQMALEDRPGQIAETNGERKGAGKALRGERRETAVGLEEVATAVVNVAERRDRQLREAGGKEFVNGVWRRGLGEKKRGRWERTANKGRRFRLYIALDCRRRGRARCRKSEMKTNLRTDRFVRIIGQAWHLFRVVRTVGEVNKKSRSCRDALNDIAGGNYEDQLTLARYAYEKGDGKAAFNILTKASRNGKVCSVVMAPNTVMSKHLKLANEHLQNAIQALFVEGGPDLPDPPSPMLSPPPVKPQKPKENRSAPKGGTAAGQRWRMMHSGGTTNDFIIDYSDDQIWDRTDSAPSNEIIITCQRPKKGSRFRSKYHYNEGVFSARIKAAAGRTDGIVTSFYTSSLEGSKDMDEIDFEFLGKDQTVIQTNFFVNGIGHREQMINLGFNAADDFHEYTLDIKKTSITWLIDGRVVRVENKADHPNGFPRKSFYLYSSMWDATMVLGGSWAGQSSFINEPYYTTYRDVTLPVKHANCPQDPLPSNSCGQ